MVQLEHWRSQEFILGGGPSSVAYINWQKYGTKNVDNFLVEITPPLALIFSSNLMQYYINF